MMSNPLLDAIDTSLRLLPYEKKQLIMLLVASELGKIAMEDVNEQIRINLNSRQYQG